MTDWRTIAEEEGLEFSNYCGIVTVKCSDTKIILDSYSSRCAPRGRLQRLAQSFLTTELDERVN